MSAATLRGLDHDVAEAADAWLNDPRDTVAYARPVAAVLRRRAYVQPTLDESPADDHRAAVDSDDGGDDGGGPPALGVSLAGEPRVILAALGDAVGGGVYAGGGDVVGLGG